MECDAAGANIYHIIVCRNTFHSLFFRTFSFNFPLEGWELWQLKLIKYALRATLCCSFYTAIVEKEKGKSSLKVKIK